MSISQTLQRRLAALLCVLATAQPAFSVGAEAAPVRQVPQVTDIAVNKQGRLPGRLIDDSGKPLAGTEVRLWRQGKLAGRATTDPEGRFQITVAQGGVHQLATPSNVQLLRIWQASAAPPVAIQDLLVVDGQVMRGQGYGGQPGIGSGVYDGRLFHALSSPWVFAGVVGAGVAVPIVISQRGDGS